MKRLLGLFIFIFLFTISIFGRNPCFANCTYSMGIPPVTCSAMNQGVAWCDFGVAGSETDPILKVCSGLAPFFPWVEVEKLQLSLFTTTTPITLANDFTVSAGKTLDFGANALTNIGPTTATGHAARKDYVDALSGGVAVDMAAMTTFNFGTHKLEGLVAATATGEAVIFDQAILTTGAQSKSGILTFADLPESMAMVTTADQLTNKTYVDSLAGGVNVFGDGSDGDAINPSPLTMDMYYNNLTIDTGVTLTTNGYAVFVKNNLAWNGTIAAGNGANGANGSDANSGAGGGGGINTRGGLQVLNGVNGGTGGGGGTGTAGTAATVANTGVAGSTGGNGGGGGQGGGGAAGAVTVLIRILDPITGVGTLRTLPLGVFANAGSGGGGGGGTNGAGGGGSGANGQTLLIVAKSIVFGGSSVVTGLGGNGGNGGTNANGGGGGGGGGSGSLAMLLFSSKTGTLTTTTLTGGTAGTGGSVGGVNGTAGTAGYVVEVLF